MRAERHNSSKPKLSLAVNTGPALVGLARVLEKGMDKYARDNWKKGFPTTELVDSLLRHLVAYMEGEDLDEESGLPHVDCVQANAMFLSYNYHVHPEMDDRT